MNLLEAIKTGKRFKRLGHAVFMQVGHTDKFPVIYSKDGEPLMVYGWVVTRDDILSTDWTLEDAPEKTVEVPQETLDRIASKMPSEMELNEFVRLIRNLA